MESEAAPVLSNMSGVQSDKLLGKSIYRGELCGDRVSVIVCGVGKANAACGAAIAIGIEGASAVINTGVAGGLGKYLKVGEICSIAYATQYDFDLAQLNGTSVGTLNEFKDRWLPLAVAGDYPKKKLATADRFNDDRRDYILLTDAFGADIRDMEGAAIAQVCINAGVPVFEYKGISDLAGSGSTTEQYVANLDKCTKNFEDNVCGIYGAVKAALKEV